MRSQPPIKYKLSSLVFENVFNHQEARKNSQQQEQIEKILQNNKANKSKKGIPLKSCFL